MRLIKAFFLVVGCIGLAWMVVKTSAVYALADKNPAAAALVAADDPRVVMGLAMQEFSAKGGEVSPELRKASINALADDPLAEEPFILAGVNALAEERSNAERLLVEARSRNPRSRITNLLLLDRQLRAGRTEEAVATMNILTRLIPGAEAVLVGQLAQFAQTKSTRPTIKQLMERDRHIKNRLLEYLASDPKDLDLIMELADAGTGQGRPAAPAEWQRRLVAALVERGEARRAFPLWARFSGIAAEAGAPRIYDPDFKRLPGFAPFNWRFSDTNAGAAEPRPGGGLQIQYYGRDQATLVDQLLLLPFGRYRLSARVEGDAASDGPTLSWRLSCSRSGPQIVDLPLSRGNSAEMVTQEFSVPAGCEVQTLALVGTPSEFAKDVFLTMTDLNLQKVS